MKLLVKKLNKNAILPKRMTEHSSGYDIFSANTEPLCLKKGEYMRIHTGFAIAIPDGFEAQIRPRSGLAYKHGLTVLNSPGTIDSDYRGEIMIILINHGQHDYIIEPQSRIAQMIVSKFETIQFELCDSLPETHRNQGGFGSTDSDIISDKK
ncbi:MAG: dUTP diphosphatase [Candidatus Cloacimonadales bacterium]|jgi:dUTP pyrophosphatase|nr:dUTP diphosphatase [Candidatus Cloacimonadota bacterium]MDD2650086.1 dUTP diphosphatase [Candidatus Cloacimonadota bacterium]MDD3501090.1 dUTP diphosphatase [Candidatus Cloacimonadota bacterium]MDX9976741.1 dUTP diphosphatase [Candidatus Cloacimonadales bacterium]